MRGEPAADLDNRLMDALTDLERLKATADRIALLEADIDIERERRDSLIVSLRDAGVSWSALSMAARVSPGRCVAIVGNAA